jgi:predicted nucleotidyltransferase
MLLDQLRSQRSAIVALGQLFGARRIRVFGSVARGEDRPDSDVDFLVELPLGYDMFSQRLPLAQKLQDLLHRHVEVIPEHELNRHIREQVLREAVEL